MSVAPTVGPSGLTAYDQIRWDIVHGVLRPNQALIESELSEQLGISRTPVREILHSLAADGLITMRRRRWYVYEHSADEIREIYEVRTAQEGYAARLACSRASDEQLAQIQNAAILIDDCCIDDRVAANDSFHSLINDASGNRRLVQLIDKARLVHFTHRLASAYSAEDLLRSSTQHDAIVTSVLARDGDAAEQIVREHVMDAASIAVRIIG